MAALAEMLSMVLFLMAFGKDSKCDMDGKKLRRWMMGTK